MTIALTGASGFVGRALLPRLAAAYPGARLRALVMPGDPLAAGLGDLVPGGLETVDGDVTAAETVDRLVAGATHVLHLAGLISYWRLENASACRPSTWKERATSSRRARGPGSDGSCTCRRSAPSASAPTGRPPTRTSPSTGPTACPT